MNENVKRPLTPLERLHSLLCVPEDEIERMSPKEIDCELQSLGVDPATLALKFEAMVADCLGQDREPPTFESETMRAGSTRRREQKDYFVIFPLSAEAKARQIRIPTYLAYGALGVVALSLVLTTYMAVQIGRYHIVRAENEQLRQQNEQYETSYASLKGQISYIRDLSVELARRAKIDQIPEYKGGGVGGPEIVTTLDRATTQTERQIKAIARTLNVDPSLLSSIPNGPPVKGYIADGFGSRPNPFDGDGRELHEGVDIAVDFGTPVSATADGLVIFAAPQAGYGNLVIIYHSNGITTRYGHLSRMAVEPGERVNRGDQIGNAGSTGRSTGPHVHYEIRQNDQPIDPMPFILGYQGVSRPPIRENRNGERSAIESPNRMDTRRSRRENLKG